MRDRDCRPLLSLLTGFDTQFWTTIIVLFDGDINVNPTSE